MTSVKCSLTFAFVESPTGGRFERQRQDYQNDPCTRIGTMEVDHKPPGQRCGRGDVEQPEDGAKERRTDSQQSLEAKQPLLQK
jgi:hypothetical protein